jgi:hypothetical protein
MMIPILTTWIAETILYIMTPVEIPEWHILHNKPYWLFGTYKRKLILTNNRIVVFIIQRIQCPTTKKVYSLLPHFIGRYQRHCNATIEYYLSQYFIEGKSFPELVEESSAKSTSGVAVPSLWTLRNWICQFKSSFDKFEETLETYLISHFSTYRTAASTAPTLANRVKQWLDKAAIICPDFEKLRFHGKLSYVQYAITSQSYSSS